MDTSKKTEKIKKTGVWLVHIKIKSTFAPQKQRKMFALVVSVLVIILVVVASGSGKVC